MGITALSIVAITTLVLIIDLIYPLLTQELSINKKVISY